MRQRPAYEWLLQIENNVAVPDRQRVMILDTSYLALQSVLREYWPELKQQCAISEMIARRMFYHFRTQKGLKKVLQISLAAAGSDVLEQAVGMYLAAYLSQFGGFEVRMNQLFDGKLRPDIAVLHNGTRLATVEVKTDLGWQRNYFKKEKNGKSSWQTRCQECFDTGFTKSYVFILTKSNWGKEYQQIEAHLQTENIFVLLVEHPNDENKFRWYKDDSTHLEKPDIIRCIEDMFEEIRL